MWDKISEKFMYFLGMTVRLKSMSIKSIDLIQPTLNGNVI